ncbi:betaine/proline/choline family ABC transporter ATP-binding protein [Rubeoparvulum massiliense]|uniref:betaine/proline/choline family ABC transporter ATP-binding protein n=1 Tax=Rubeoparvulum massiliense TaxID=1631346 RepID=UPI00065E2B34|nr:ABC transporter ATP-binding protein [Rubeoparvulum massiliense]
MIQFQEVSKKFKEQLAVRNITFTIEEGEFIVLIGESGSGKTTTMKMINRLIEPTSGTILINGHSISTINPIQLRRSIGYVIQKVGLFPHMTVGENIEIVPLLKHWSAEDRRARAEELMDLVGLPAKEYYERYPHQLSGGQQQRIGIARALAGRPHLILMDEPFSALDPITREQLHDEMLRIHEELNTTIVMVSHDMDEAIKLADRIGVMKDGELLQFGTPEEILLKPANHFVEDLVGRDRLWRQPELLVVSEIMSKQFPTITPEKNVEEAIHLMHEKRLDYLLVINEQGLLLGEITPHELHGQESHIAIHMLMKNTIPPLHLNNNLVDALDRMRQKRHPVLPVLDDEGRLCGVITRANMLRTLTDLLPIH